MGAVSSIWKKETVEQALERLEKRITKLEYRQRTSYLSRKKAVSALLLYSIIVEVVIAVWYYLHKKPEVLFEKLIHASPLLLFPILAFLLKHGITFYYYRRIISDEASLVKLRAALKTKLDERKKATDFDATQKLLSKYEKLVDSKEVNGRDSPGKKERPSTSQNKANTSADNSNTTPSKLQSPPSSLRHRPAQQTNDEQQQLPSPVQQQSKQVQSPSQQNTPPLQAAGNQKAGWVNRLVDYLVGTGPQYGFALICEKCSSHNGLAHPSEPGSITFRCRTCNHLNECSPQQQPQAPNRVRTRSQSTTVIELPNPATIQQAQPQQPPPIQSLRTLTKSQSFTDSPRLPRSQKDKQNVAK